MTEPQKSAEIAKKTGAESSIHLPSHGRGGHYCVLGVLSRLVASSHCIPVLLIAAFVTALLWAKSRDPFRRIEFSVKTVSGMKVKGMAVLPKTAKSFPAVVYLHGSRGSLLQSESELRQIAEQNLAAVGLEYDQTNQTSFDDQFIALHEYLSMQSWVRKSESGAMYQMSGPTAYASPTFNSQPSTISIAWIGVSLGAQGELSFLLKHPEYQPSLLVRLGGGWVEELGEKSNSPLGPSTISHQLSTNSHFLLVHGENDNIFPAADCLKLADSLKAAGVPVDLCVFPGRSHGFGADKMAVIRGVGEYCARFFDANSTNHRRPLHINTRPLLVHYWLPFGFLVAVILFVQYARWREWRKATGLIHDKWSTALLVVAWILGIATIAGTAFHLGFPHLRITESRLDVARLWLVQPHLKDEFDWLSQQPIWHNQKLKTLLEHVELADYNRGLVNWNYDETIFCEFILSPRIEPATRNSQPATSLFWRRPLWENFYPRIRRKTDPLSAAQMVVRFLRERVSVISDSSTQTKTAPEIATIWRTGLANEREFEHIYVATLRSVGIAARLDDAGQAELFTNGQWQQAPQPLFKALNIPAMETEYQSNGLRIVRSD